MIPCSDVRAHRLGGDQNSEPVEVLASSGNVNTSCVRQWQWQVHGSEPSLWDSVHQLQQ